MKRKLLAFGMILSFGLMISCGDDDSDSAPPPHEVGDWDLDSYLLLNLPSDYASREGQIQQLNEITFNGVAFESYTLNLMANGTYTRRIELPGPNVNDNGTWEADDDELTLVSEDFDDSEDFEIERNQDDQLWLSVASQFLLIRDAVADTLTQEYVSTLSEEEFDALFDVVSLDLVYAFERE
ncbi:MAG: hypothetical protein AAF519_17835 [Bacteroidota bacterium]